MRAPVLLPLLAVACAVAPKPAPDPALRLHGHNDYLQPVPLVRALELGLGSLEADIFLVDGELRVGHERWQLRPGRTLQSMYLDPLLAAFRRCGSLRSDGQPLVLLVDVKADGDKVYTELRDVLPRYRDMLSRFVDGRVEPGAVTVLLSGNRPVSTVAADAERWCAIDGRLRDLDRRPPPPAHLVPWVSSSWRSISDWTGSDDLMPHEIERITDLVTRAHRQGRELRFWGAPDRREAWGAFYDLGVDRIGSDQPKKAAAWLRSERGGAR
ncbi:MAG: phosphatidylinositol-specific phospholipase C/glycerophosphodiester phosphodiesterase family protein [Planctomycetota bacterium]